MGRGKSSDHKPPGRGRLSTIDALPEDIRVRLNAALRERRLTQRQIVDHFNELLSERGEARISKSSLNRYATYIEARGAMMREAREAAEALVGGLSEQKDKGDLGRAVSEMVKTLAMDIVLKHGDDGPIDVGLLKNLAQIVERVERAAKLGVDRELRIKEEIAAEATDKLNGAVKSGQLDPEAARSAMRIMGFDDG